MYALDTEVELTTGILGIGKTGSTIVDTLDASSMNDTIIISLTPEHTTQYAQSSSHFLSSDMVIIVGDFSKNTDTEAAIRCAEILKDTAMFIIAVTIRQSDNDENQLHKHFKSNLRKLKGAVDSLIVIPADGTDSSLNTCAHAVKTLYGFTQLSEFMNMDYGDFRYALIQKGFVVMGVGIGTGESRALDAAMAAISSPQFSDNLLKKSAESVLISISWGSNFSWDEFKEVMFYFTEYFSGDKRLILAEARDDSLEDDMCVTIFAVVADA